MLMHALLQCYGCWLTRVGIVQCCITHVAQNTQHCDKVMKDFCSASTVRLEGIGIHRIVK